MVIPSTLTLSVAAAAACVPACSVFFLQLPTLRPLVTPIYVRKGILPQVATALQSASELNARPEEA